MWWKFTEGVRTDGVIFCTRLPHGWACPVRTRRHSHVHGRWDAEGCIAHHSVPSEGAAISSKRNKSCFLLGKTLQTPISQTPKTESKGKTDIWTNPRVEENSEKNTLAVTNKFWILTFRVCFLDFLWNRGVCGVLGWLAGKVVYRYVSFI